MMTLLTQFVSVVTKDFWWGKSQNMLNSLNNEVITISLLDEPTAAMDERSCDVFDEIISSLNSVLCIVVTHRINASLGNYGVVIALKDVK